MKNKKKIVILTSIIIVICTILVCTILINRNQIEKIAKRLSNLGIKEITYEVSFDSNKKLVLFLKVTDTENGISEIKLPDGNKIICKEKKEQVGLDYIVEDYGPYTFISKSKNGEEIIKIIEMDDIIEKALENEDMFEELAMNEFIAKRIVNTDILFSKIKNNENNEKFFNNINIAATEEITLVNDENPYYIFEAKANQRYFIQCYGAQGGSNYYREAPGGRGGYSCGTIILPQDTTLYIYKGGVGASTVSGGTAAGGYNGGGALQYGWGDGHEMRSSGGGATHIALIPRLIINSRK